jgi:hypothetical protein
MSRNKYLIHLRILQADVKDFNTIVLMREPHMMNKTLEDV